MLLEIRRPFLCQTIGEFELTVGRLLIRITFGRMISHQMECNVTREREH